ncbi:hypothetical protein ARMSODRAFT_971549 [Armillaria solidipes]|uniref:Uncharacterized protein n=1 Tax=Armillaria solidipes TaxID=1076256 RepID=A0A2H3CG94_9AGAR|nr:hypothetical protein ARMSODRAFT_971549 [Armillaria solidipes]
MSDYTERISRLLVVTKQWKNGNHINRRYEGLAGLPEQGSVLKMYRVSAFRRHGLETSGHVFRILVRVYVKSISAKPFNLGVTPLHRQYYKASYLSSIFLFFVTGMLIWFNKPLATIRGLEIRIQNNVTIVEGSLEDDFAPTQRINVWRARARAWDTQTWGKRARDDFHDEDDESMASPVWSFPNLRVLSGIGTTTVIFATPSREKYLEIRKRCVAPERSEILFLIRIETASSNAEVNFLTLLPANAFHPSGSSMISMCHPSILFPLNPLKDFPSFRHGSAG